MKLCQCGCDTFEPVYDRVPYGNTVALLEADQLCTNCRASIEYAADICMGCDRELDACLCNLEETVIAPLQQAANQIQVAILAAQDGNFDKAREQLWNIADLVDMADISLIDKGAYA